MKCPRCSGGVVFRPTATWMGECFDCKGVLLITMCESGSIGGGSDTSPTPVLLPDDFLKRYEVLRPIGEGATASVFLAKDRSNDTPVALKFLATPGRRQVLQRFAREARLLAAIRHKNVIRLHDSGDIEGRPFLVSEFCPGGTLRSKMRGAKLTPGQSVELMLEVLAGLDACHKAGVIHRDMKPENVLLTADGEIRVADLGVAREEVSGEPSLTPKGGVIGTPRYMAPEQVRGERATPATDVYAAGAILYEMLTGDPPFADEHTFELLVAHLERAPAAIRDRFPDVPLALEAITLKALAKLPAGRPGSAGAFSRELKHIQKILAGEAADVPAVSAPVSTPGMPLPVFPLEELEPKSPWRSRIMPAAVMLAIVLVAASRFVGQRAAAPPSGPEVVLPLTLPQTSGGQAKLEAEWQQKFAAADQSEASDPQRATQIYEDMISIAEKISPEKQARTYIKYGRFKEKSDRIAARNAYRTVLSLSKDDETRKTAELRLNALGGN